MAADETLKQFDKVYKETYTDIAKYVVCHVKNASDVEDILQNIYLNAYKEINKGKELSYIYLLGIAKHKVKDYYRFHYKEKIVSFFSSKEDGEFSYPDTINIEKSTTLKFDTELVWEYLKKKNVVIFQIFYLYYVSALTLKEIAINLNITESNVKHYLYRTLKELKENQRERGE